MEKYLFHTLQSDLKMFDKIILIIDKQELGLLESLCNSRAMKKSEYKTLLLSTKNLASTCISAYRYISEEDCNMLCRLYDMYEFSDKFKILSKEKGYGNLFNFTETGIFNMEDLFEALMY